MTALYGPQTANAVTERPADKGQRYGALQTWFKNCSGPGATDGTVPDAAFYNRIIGALDYLVGQSGISALPGDDSALYRAIIQVFEGAAPTALNSLKELADAIGNDPNFAGTLMTMLGNRLRFDAAQTLTTPQKAQAVLNLGLAAVAVSGAYADLTGKPTLFSGAYADLTGKPTLGTAAALDVGTTANKVVQLDAAAKLPAVDGSRLTGLASSITTSNLTASLNADVALSVVNTWYDGPSVAQGNVGKWQACATVTVTNLSSATEINWKLHDGTTVIASGSAPVSASGARQTICTGTHMLNTPAGPLRISLRDIATATSKMEFNRSGQGKDCTITAVRIA